MDDKTSDEFQEIPDKPTETDTEIARNDRFQEPYIAEGIDKIKNLLGEVEIGSKVSIIRRMPAYCSGWLETLTITEDMPLSMEYIAETWGGEILQLKVSDHRSKYLGATTITLRSYPPRHQGVLIPPPSIGDIADFYEAKKSRPSMSAAAQQRQEPEVGLKDIFSLMQKQRREDLSMFQQMIDNKTRAQPQSVSGFGELVKNAKEFAALKEFLSPEIQEKSVDSSDDPMASIERMMGMYLKTKAVPSANQNREMKLVESTNDGQGAKLKEVPQANEQMSLVHKLAAMDPSTAAETVVAALGSMAPDKKQAAIAEVWSIFSGDGDSDEDDDDEIETKGVS